MLLGLTTLTLNLINQIVYLFKSISWLSNITKYKCLHLMNKSRKQCALKERYKNKIYTDDNLFVTNPIERISLLAIFLPVNI